ncbi:MAG: FHA domain-containing protein [Anaerolineae bacterium]|nr:FHA domain-containing protein [Anaerolineae bacterium]MDQ7035809.1 FHA domain-containing protein [Anaerolineae bacterium]
MAEQFQKMRITNEVSAIADNSFKRLTGMLTQPKKMDCLRFVLPDGRHIDALSRIYIMLGRSDGGVAQDPIDVDFASADAAKNGVSHEHAVIQVVNGRVVIKDFNSRNGTFINGQKLYTMREYPLADGDEIMLGRLPVRVQFIG